MKNDKVLKFIWKIVHRFGFPAFALMTLLGTVLSFVVGEVVKAVVYLLATAFFALLGYGAWAINFEE